jgi:butyrate kinase
MFKILSINPGSTSTKIAVYENERLLFQTTIRHSSEELAQFADVLSQFEFRKELILNILKTENFSLSEFSAIVGRGGMLRPVESGVYEVNETMLSDLRTAIPHASNLGALLASSIATNIPVCRAFIADPVVVDELQDTARISGLPQFPRKSVFHALNHKAIARKFAAKIGVKYENLRLVVAHLGGGISVAAHEFGKVIDVNQALNGYGAFSPERSGTFDADALVKLCFSGEYTQDEIHKLITGRGGLVAHLGTNNVTEVENLAKNGNAKAKILLEAMAYQVAKEIGAMHVALGCLTNAILITGGIANCEFVVEQIVEKINALAKVEIFAGEDELEALAFAALRVLKGDEVKRY